MNTRNSMFHLLVVVAGKGYVNSYNGFQSRKLLESHPIRNRTFLSSSMQVKVARWKMPVAAWVLSKKQFFHKAVCQTKTEMYAYIPTYMHAPVHAYIHTQFTWTYRHVHTCMHELICKYAHKESLDCLDSCSSFCPSTIRLHCIRTSFFRFNLKNSLHIFMLHL